MTNRKNIEKKGFDTNKNRFKSVEKNNTNYKYTLIDNTILEFNYLKLQKEFKQVKKKCYADITYYANKHNFHYTTLYSGLKNVNPSPRFNLRLYNLLIDIQEGGENTYSTLECMVTILNDSPYTITDYHKQTLLSPTTIRKYRNEIQKDPELNNIKLVRQDTILKVHNANELFLEKIVQEGKEEMAKNA